MSCKEALIPSVITISPELSVEDALKLINDNSIRSAPIVDADGKYHGMFGLHALMDDLLPTAARMEGGLDDLGFVTGGAPGAAKRIRKLAPQRVESIIQEADEEAVLSPDMPMLEVIRRLAKHGSPLPVLGENQKYIGLVSEQSCLRHLRNVLETVENEEKNS